MVKSDTVEVAVGIVCHQNRILVAQRGPHQHCPDLWEFPGGKMEAVETPFEALRRELHEEVGIMPLRSEYLGAISHHFPDKHVILHAFWVDRFEGQAFGSEGQSINWVTQDELSSLSIPPANVALLKQISLKLTV